MPRFQPGRLFVVLLCLLLGLFFAVEMAHGHAEPGGHCDLCLLTHAPALLPVLPALAAALGVLFAAATVQAPLRIGSRVRVHRIRPPPFAA